MDTRTLCLGALTSGPATGYEIKKHFEDTFGYFMEVSHSAVYPALAELLQEGLVTVSRVEQETRPDKKVYSLTAAGRARFRNDLAASPGKHRVRSEFLVLMFFAQWLSPEKLCAVIDAQREEFARLGAAADCWLKEHGTSMPAGMRFTAGYGTAVIRAAIDYLDEHRDELLAARDGSAPDRDPAADALDRAQTA